MWNMVGQEGAVELLRQGLGKGNLAHAYLFVGPPHVGKMALALKLAQALNCDGAERPCGSCRPCQRIASGKHADVQVIAPLRDEQGRPKREIGIDQVRELQHTASLKPYEGRHRVFIVEGAERLTQDAANCFLKTLEEPPAQVLILLLAQREGDLLLTLRSRCQKVMLHPLPMGVVEKALIEAGREASQARLLAHLSQGRIGWALSASAEALAQRQAKLDQLFSLLQAGREERFAYASDLAARLARDKDEAQEELELWLTWWRDLLLIKGGHPEFVTNLDQEPTLSAQARSFSMGQVARFLAVLRRLGQELEQNANPRLALEVLMLDLPIRGEKEGVGLSPP